MSDVHHSAAESPDRAPAGTSVPAAVLDALRELVSELHRHRPPPVALDSDLERDLGLDSLALAELLVRLEDEFSVRLPESILRSATTPRDLVRAVGSGAPRTRHARRRPAITARPTQRAVALCTLTESINWHTEVHPDRLHVRILGEDDTATELTYEALRREAGAVAKGLLEGGVSPGESVALMLPTGRDYFVTFLGIVLAGAVAVPLYPPARPALLDEHLRRQSAILDNARATVLVSPSEAKPLARLLRSTVESLRQVRAPEDLASPGDVVLPVTRPQDTVLLQYTSGSTGNPKGVVLTHRDLLANIDAMVRAARAGPEDIFVSWLPLYHDMGLIGAWLGSLHVGMPLVVMSPQSFLLRPIRWLEAISEHRATLSAAPNFAYELCLSRVSEGDLGGLDLSTWRVAFNGAEAVNPRTIRRFSERFASCGLRPDTLLPVYGLAEAAVGLCFPPLGRAPLIDRIRRSVFATSGQATRAAADEHDVVEFVGCGRPLPGYELRVVDDADREVPERIEGHVQFRGPSATSGYFRNSEASRELFHGDWLDTGDLGYLADGDLFVTGRVKDLIVRAGRNLHPDEAERSIGEVPGVRTGCVAVLGVPDPVSGTERLVVVAETRETDPDALAEIRHAVTSVVARVLGSPADDVVLALPGTVPKTPSGKIRRAEARTRYERGELRPGRKGVWRQVASFTFFGIPTRWRRLRHAVADIAYGALGWGVLIGIGGPLCVLLALVPGRRLRWAVLKTAARSALAVTRIPVRVRGATSLPAGSQVLVANHASWADGIALVAALPGPLRFVAGEVFARQMVVGFALRRIGAVFIHRWDREQGVADAGHLAELATGTAPLVVFPEGGLSSQPGLRSFHLGAFVAAAQAGTAVVPVAIRGTRRIVPPGRKLLRRGAVDIVVGEALRPEGTNWHDAVVLRDAAREHILRHCGETDLD